MCAKNLLHSLYQYKAWSEAELFRCLKAPIAKSFPAEMEKACYWLSHINIVDQLFIARLKGAPDEFDSVVTDQPQDLIQLEEQFSKANQWFVDTQKPSRQRIWLITRCLLSRMQNQATCRRSKSWRMCFPMVCNIGGVSQQSCQARSCRGTRTISRRF